MTEDQDGTSFFTNVQERGLGEYSPADDRMHDEANAQVSHPELVETQYLGFNVPSAGIHAFNYVWVHPNIGTTSGGAWAWKGINPSQLHCEIFDMREFMPLSAVGDFSKYVLPNGYGVEVVKPLEEIRITYEDSSRNNAFDVTLSAIMPPAMLPSGRHFEQGMRTSGTVRLLGEEHTVDGFTMRDRSWGETRPEQPRQAPPFHFLCPGFTDDFMIHVCAMEDPTQKPLYSKVIDFPPEQAAAYGRGWVWRDGELSVLESVTLTCEWDLSTRYPSAYHVDMVDAAGRSWTMTGTVIAGSNWFLWPNVYAPVLLARWECDGQVGYGDAQVGAWTDFVRECLP
jgi:hypothetical protein